MSALTVKDRIFLQRNGIKTAPIPEDGTTQTLREMGLPLTWENWLTLQTAGHLDIEIDGEMEALIAEWAQDDDEEDNE